jgi:hypothetical protein
MMNHCNTNFAGVAGILRMDAEGELKRYLETLPELQCEVYRNNQDEIEKIYYPSVHFSLQSIEGQG